MITAVSVGLLLSVDNNNCCSDGMNGSCSMDSCSSFGGSNGVSTAMVEFDGSSSCDTLVQVPVLGVEVVISDATYDVVDTGIERLDLTLGSFNVVVVVV